MFYLSIDFYLKTRVLLTSTIGGNYFQSYRYGKLQYALTRAMFDPCKNLFIVDIQDFVDLFPDTVNDLIYYKLL